MFDRQFFSADLFKLVAQFKAQNPTDHPLVEAHLSDGTWIQIMGVSALSDQWVAFTVHEEMDLPVQVVVPYSHVLQIKLYPTDPDQKHLGFRHHDPA